MTTAEIEQEVSGRLRSQGFEVERVQVESDPFGGIRLRIVSDGLSELDPSTQRSTALAGLEPNTVNFFEVISTADATMVPSDLRPPLEEIPAWPEALARAYYPIDEALFPSELDEDIDRPIIVTFYSMKGGVGRSTALAYTARILASRTRSVLCIDADLEAPGLLALFGKNSTELADDVGLAHLLYALDLGEEPDVTRHIVRLSDSDELYLLPAGLPSANYARILRLLDPDAWYRESDNPLRKLLDRTTELAFRPDVILLDARTGISPTSAPLLFDLSDLAVVVFFPHEQTRIGTQLLVRAILSAKSRRKVNGASLTPEPRFLVSPIPTGAAEAERYRLRAYDWISSWLSDLNQRRRMDSAIEAEDITHFIGYREAIAITDETLEDEESWSSYHQVAEWVERFLPTPSEERQATSVADSKSMILRELQFSAGTAEEQENFLASFVRTDVVKRALGPRVPLVIGRKGTGKTAVFRRLVEDSSQSAIVVVSPSALRGEFPWVVSAASYKLLEDQLQPRGIGWRDTWLAYTTLAVLLQARVDRVKDAQLGPILREFQRHVKLDDPLELDVVQSIVAVLARPEGVLEAWDLMQRCDRRLRKEFTLLFDGLDTGFGHLTEELSRRTRAIEGLLSFMLEREALLKKLRFKILLREDIWKSLRLQNKSHLYGRSVRLEWRSQADYFKPLLRQAVLSPTFASATDRMVPSDDVTDWTPDEVFRVWNLLVGERMKGGKTHFTRNWVWSRLADGNDDHGPRALFQLFKEATTWEREEESRTPYDRSIIRPRALIQSLDRVSEEALDALEEEFVELSDLIDHLRRIGRSPVDASELEQQNAAVDLAREVGLLAVYEGTEEEVRRYKVPDLYRIALGMTRRGPA
jgi:MinD-like ATPase involved in chromosome partitioning or flagellar assembly